MSLPRASKHDMHLWVDYIELLCLVNLDRQVSKADVLDRVRERVEDLGEGEAQDEDIEEEEVSRPEINDRWDGRAEDWFRHLIYRSGAFKEFYPFEVLPSGTVIQVRKRLNVKQKLYISFLLASSLGRYSQYQDDLTRSFEKLSYPALRTCLPSHASVHIFGTSEQTGKYKGKLWNKIKTLAEDLCETVRAKEEDFAPSDTGDNGLDVVGWVPFEDKNSGRLIIFGQCACTPNWIHKQRDSDASRWQNFISLKAPSSNMVFIPYCFRSANGTWHNESDIVGSILVDRLRFVHLLRKNMDDFKVQPSYKVVDDILSQRESVF